MVSCFSMLIIGIGGATVAQNSGRITIIDELRGLAVMCMIVYHTLFTLGSYFDIRISIAVKDASLLSSKLL